METGTTESMGAASRDAADPVRTGEALAQLVLYASGRPELAALVPLFGGVARTFGDHFRARGIDPGPFSAIVADIERITDEGIAADGAFRRRHRPG